MENTNYRMDFKNYFPDIANLPEAAHKELISFYEFLLFKYNYKEQNNSKMKYIKHDDKKSILSKIFADANGQLPPDYTFDREELHER
ncbi:MAG: hypothetical protein HQK63_02160 [Desulfamplus sp.]|nr:hypothetical protein [Desulfamplus sp.]